MENKNRFSGEYAKNLLKGIGGKDNIQIIDNCITRLRLVLNEPKLVDKTFLIDKTDAVRIIVDKNNVQIVYGVQIDKIREALDDEIKQQNRINETPKKILKGIGGKDNIQNIDNCITRLRFILKDNSKLDKDFLIKETNAVKVIETGDEVHIVYGLRIDEIRKALDAELLK